MPNEARAGPVTCLPHAIDTHILAGTTKKPKQKPFASISRATFLGNKSGGATKNKQTTKQPKDNCTMLRCKWIQQFLPSCLYCYLAFLCCFSDATTNHTTTSFVVAVLRGSNKNHDAVIIRLACLQVRHFACNPPQ